MMGEPVYDKHEVDLLVALKDNEIEQLKATIAKWEGDYLANEKERSHLANVVVPNLRASLGGL